MQILQYWCYMVSLSCASNQSSCRVLHALQTSKKRAREAIQQSICIIESRSLLGLELRGPTCIIGDVLPDPTDIPDLVEAGLRYSIYLPFHCHITVHEHTQIFYKRYCLYCGVPSYEALILNCLVVISTAASNFFFENFLLSWRRNSKQLSRWLGAPLGECDIYLFFQTYWGTTSGHVLRRTRCTLRPELLLYRYNRASLLLKILAVPVASRVVSSSL